MGTDVWGGMCSWTVATWLSMVLWPFIRLDLALYLCTSAMLHVLPYYGCVTGDIASVSSGMTWDSVWGGCLFAHPGVIVTVYLLMTLWRGTGYGVTAVASCCVLPLHCGGSGVYTLGSFSGGGGGVCGTALLKMSASCFIAAVCIYPSCGMVMDGTGFWRDSVRSAAALVTASFG